MNAADASPEDGEGAQKDAGRGEKAASYSGRLLLRMPETLHAKVARAAEAEHVSLNQFIVDTLETKLDPDAPKPKAATPAAGAASPGRPRPVSWLLVANLVVVAIVGVLAIVLIVQALTS